MAKPRVTASGASALTSSSTQRLAIRYSRPPKRTWSQATSKHTILSFDWMIKIVNSWSGSTRIYHNGQLFPGLKSYISMFEVIFCCTKLHLNYHIELSYKLNYFFQVEKTPKN